uniref:Uncharacterized protein n=1 Tax=Acrobeloides nanus TaxID=290746 RepID=A0A914EJU5_9BILA
MASTFHKKLKPIADLLKTAISEANTKKGTFKAKIDIDKGDEENLEENEPILEEITYHLSRISRSYNDLKEAEITFNELLKSMTGNERIKEIQKHDEYLNDANNDYLTTLAKANDAISFLEAKQRDLKRVILKLTPKEETHVPVDEFDGKPLNYHQFINMFDPLIHDNDELNQTQKCIYLLRSLKGRIKQETSKFMPPSDRNYELLRAYLKTNFDDTKKLIIKLHHDFQNLSLKSGRTADLKRFIDDLDRILNLLEMSGEDANHNQLLITIQKAIPSNVLEQVYMMKKAHEEVDVEVLRKYLRVIVANKEAVVKMSKPSSEANPNSNSSSALVSNNARKGNFRGRGRGRGNFNRNFVNQKVVDSSSQSQAQVTSSSQSKYRNGCPFCGGDHG